MSRSDPATEAFACAGKEKLAGDVARKVAKRQEGTAYRCAHCGAWHVGHRPPHRVAVLHRRPRYYDNDEE